MNQQENKIDPFEYDLVQLDTIIKRLLLNCPEEYIEYTHSLKEAVDNYIDSIKGYY